MKFEEWIEGTHLKHLSKNGIEAMRDCWNIAYEQGKFSQPLEVEVKPACERCVFFDRTRTSSEYLDGYCTKILKSFNKDFWCKHFELSKSV